MYTRRSLLGSLLIAPAAPFLATGLPLESDPRNVVNGSLIPRENYSDQPYVVITNDGNWLCVLTTGRGNEGHSGQHAISTISSDQGRTWSAPVDIEPADGPEASWVMPLKVPSGRVYVFYNYNKGNIRSVRSNSQTYSKRVDTLGAYVFKFSDDNGRTWSSARYEIPMRKMRIDRENEHNGEIMFFWGVGKPILTPKYAIFGFAKVGRWGEPGGMVESQGCFLRSDNILTERDPDRIRWTLLPDGDEGLHAPKGAVSDETNLVSLSDGSLYATYRTIDGYPCHAYSRDGGHNWTKPAYMTYSPGGRRVKHPRAANFVKKFSNGKYLYWFHNHGGDAAQAPAWTNFATGYYRNRNPAWVLGGVEKDGYIHWSQPEILLYDVDAAVRMSYPDFVEDKGRFFVTETQKELARVHEIDHGLLEGVWNQQGNHSIETRERAVDLRGDSLKPGATFPMPRLGNLVDDHGVSIDFWLKLRELSAGQIILSTIDSSGKGLQIGISDRFTLKLTLNDGRQEWSWDSDPGTQSGTLRVNDWQHAAVIVDGGPKIVSFVVDGVFNDGGDVRQFGWARFPKYLGDVNGAPRAEVAKGLYGNLGALRVYMRYLRTSEAVGNFRGGRG
jgi:Concanavalin A-like lectin/glucanases superfamily/BNR repeat-like domain